MDKKEKIRKVCRKGIHNSWMTRESGARYCLPCLEFNDAVRDYKRYGYLGPKRLTIIKRELDFQLSLVESQIAELQLEARSLRSQKRQWTKVLTSKTKK